jgi:hypothetical protein
MGASLPALSNSSFVTHPTVRSYILAIGRKLKTRYKEHIRNKGFNKEDSAFAPHILGISHQYVPMEQIMEMFECVRKDNVMNIKENYYIYQFKQLSKLIKE